MFLPTTVSNTAVKKAFTNFGKVHAVFAGTYREKQFKGICNGERHIPMTLFRSKQDLPHKIQFGKNRKLFHAIWAEKKAYCKKCGSFHMLKGKCYSDQQNTVYQENGVTYDTRIKHPDRDEADEQITKPMGPVYP